MMCLKIIHDVLKNHRTLVQNMSLILKLQFVFKFIHFLQRGQIWAQICCAAKLANYCFCNVVSEVPA